MANITGPRRPTISALLPRQWPTAPLVKIIEGAVIGRYPGGTKKGCVDNIGADPSLICAGVARNTVDNTASSDPGPDVYADERCWLLLASGLDETAEGESAFAVDNQTFTLTDNGLPLIGVVWQVQDSTHAWVNVGRSAIALATSVSTTRTLRVARNVATSNVASLSAYTVAANDGVTNVAGDVVILTAQTTAAQNGPYVVGTVATGTAPVTRPSWWSAGSAIVNGSTIEVSEGAVYAGSTWKAMCTGACVVGTNDPILYPRVFKKTVTLVLGAATIGAGGDGAPLFLFSTTKSLVLLARNTANTTTLTVDYAAPVASRIAGAAGTAAVLVHAEVAAGTLNNADISTLDVLIVNW
jgi:hypothetical protein